MPNKQSPLINRFSAWLETPGPASRQSDEAEHFRLAAVVLDANVLLDLYRLTAQGREQIMKVLRGLAEQRRLWLPHQVAVELVRNRATAVQGRVAALSSIGKLVSSRLQSSQNLVKEARDAVAELVGRMTQDPGLAAEIRASMDDPALEKVFAEWRTTLGRQVEDLRRADAFTPRQLIDGDSLLPEIGHLYDDRIGNPLPEREVRDLVEHAIAYRYPNRIPPGFADADKPTDLASAGDYLMWEEIIAYANTMARPRRLILVSGDTKGDWYELDANGRPLQPWPSLVAELKQRAKTDILILTPRLFLEGAQIHLGADFNPETYQEVDRIADEDLAEAHGAEDDPGKERHISADSLVATALQGSQRVSRRLDKRLMRLVDEREMLRAALAAAGSAQADSTPDNRSYRRAIEMRIDLLERRIESLGIEIERSGQP
ncbi:PIN-like domain-containing protein [Micromonospora sp. HK10]|uniref:PIN-like domain-containing protein n=1 Tax=Micromonospora sp. HK10 TaxID=1538294 RepID=UPI000A758314|nr:PIN-like domain-containing protein [Micromonospora sp. HK10]